MFNFKKYNKNSIRIKRFKMTNNVWVYCILFFLFSIFITENTYAQYEYLLEFEELYPGCVDDMESTIYGGTYKDKWAEELDLPIFPGGGDVQLTRYVFNNIEYPDVVDSITPGTTPESDSIVYRSKGVVMVQVVIDRCGRASRQEVLQSVNTEYDMEAMRIVGSLPVFKPGAINGERVKVALIIQVHFTRNTIKKKVAEAEDYYYNVADYDSW